MKLLVLVSSLTVALSSQCFAKDCESCSFQAGCMWQSTSRTCVEKAACTPVNACIDQPSSCAGFLTKAMQEGRVEIQIIDPGRDKTNFTCQLDECSTSQDPLNLCKVMGGLNFEVRGTAGPDSGTVTITKYMYVCICGPEWESGPNHRYCRQKELPTGFGSNNVGKKLFNGDEHTLAEKPSYGMAFGGFHEDVPNPFSRDVPPNPYNDLKNSFAIPIGLA